MNPEKETKAACSNSILWNAAIVFSLLITLSWLTELLHIPHLVFGDPFTPSWHRAGIRTAVLLLIWAWMHWTTRRLLKRLHHLEEFLRICSWCRKVGAGEKWLTMEDFFNSKFATHTTHGMCPECLHKVVKELEEPPPKKN
ncbi:MAG TPA: hypothetical protein VG347_09045 [Verrucomicrobiae bacterium]|nr:hypothetical protein [Verrucomicrobiae bacterium]